MTSKFSALEHACACALTHTRATSYASTTLRRTQLAVARKRVELSMRFDHALATLIMVDLPSPKCTWTTKEPGIGRRGTGVGETATSTAPACLDCLDGMLLPQGRSSAGVQQSKYLQGSNMRSRPLVCEIDLSSKFSAIWVRPNREHPKFLK